MADLVVKCAATRRDETDALVRSNGAKFNRKLGGPVVRRHNILDHAVTVFRMNGGHEIDKLAAKFAWRDSVDLMCIGVPNDAVVNRVPGPDSRSRSGKRQVQALDSLANLRLVAQAVRHVMDQREDGRLFSFKDVWDRCHFDYGSIFLAMLAPPFLTQPGDQRSAGSTKGRRLTRRFDIEQ